MTRNQVGTKVDRRRYLTEPEIKRLLAAAKKGRHGERDFCLVLLAYRHGLRATELVDLRLSDLDLETGRIFVRRVKGSVSASHPLPGDELRAIRSWLRARGEGRSPFLFLGERGPMTRWAVTYLVGVIGKRAGIEVDVHPHMLRHSCGYYLANRGYDTRLIQDYLGHKNIAHTVRYTKTAAVRFEGLWR